MQHIKIISQKLCFISSFLLITLSIFCSPVHAQMPDSVRVHLDSCFSILKENSLYTNRVDWNTTRKKVFEKAKTAKNKSDAFEAMKIAFDALGDMHAAYYHLDKSYILENKKLISRYSDSIKAGWKSGPRIEGKMIGTTAYLRVPYIGVTKQEQIESYGNWIYKEVSQLKSQNPKAWIIDLRLNGGGNIRPMLAGLAPFFKDGIISYYINNKGKSEDKSSFKGGDFLMDGEIQAHIKNKITSFPDAKVAVLVGPGTGSSGEITAAVFSKRSNTVLLGDDTAGLANATNGFVFNDNKTYFRMSNAYIADSNKKKFPEIIKPDIYVKDQESFNNISNDPAVQKAIDYLKQKNSMNKLP
ncbi:S41 family peptidase [Epilithonimonas mollis]|uniref:Peptidase family S41 n=1 Tax=Epilithonimonas mollis TaxID=216903 RepID=A0A1M6NQC7_9FLAO|nr:S41 family peptidase [Epilithonimonas mollis]SHJ97923.1 Peptidase family S41 [Epilithonimonas mollis]